MLKFHNTKFKLTIFDSIYVVINRLSTTIKKTCPNKNTSAFLPSIAHSLYENMMWLYPIERYKVCSCALWWYKITNGTTISVMFFLFFALESIFCGIWEDPLLKRRRVQTECTNTLSSANIYSRYMYMKLYDEESGARSAVCTTYSRNFYKKKV